MLQVQIPITYSPLSTLSSILSGPVPPERTRAVPSDVVGCSLEVNGSDLWWGDFGVVGNYAAFAALVSANASKIEVGSTAYVDNPLVKSGRTQVVVSPSGVVRAANGATLYENYNLDGTAFLDTTAALLTPGTVAELWSSPVLPDWFFQGIVTYFADIHARNLSGSVATYSLVSGIRTSALASSQYNAIIGYGGANSSTWRGPSSLGNTLRCVSGTLQGKEGATQTWGGEGNKTVGNYATGLTKARIAYNAGATTDQVVAHSVTLKAGVC